MRVSANINGTSERPRIVVFRSNRYIYAQAVDDVNKVTLAHSSGQKIEGKKLDQAKAAGLKLAEELKAKKISQAIFDRSSYSYKGRVKSLCEGVREGGIKI